MSMSTMSSWFVKVGSQPPTGGVSLVRYDAATGTAVEQDLILGLKKPVGIAVHGDALYVADQENNVILRYDLNALLAAPAPSRVGTAFAQIESRTCSPSTVRARSTRSVMHTVFAASRRTARSRAWRTTSKARVELLSTMHGTCSTSSIGRSRRAVQAAPSASFR